MPRGIYDRKPKRHLTKSARKRISKAQKERWAAWSEAKNKTNVLSMPTPTPEPSALHRSLDVNTLTTLVSRAKIYEMPVEAYIMAFLEGYDAASKEKKNVG